MLSIAVCADDPGICSDIERIMSNYTKKNPVSIGVETYLTGTRLLEDLANSVYFDLIFINTNPNDTKGFDIGKKIREDLMLEFIGIVYLSSTYEFQKELFKLFPVSFLHKPICEEHVILLIEGLLKWRRLFDLTFTYKTGWTEKKAFIRNILYFKSEGQVVAMHTTEGTIRFYDTLKKVYQRLEAADEKFLFCHKSYIVSYYHVEEFHYNCLIMKNQDKIPIGDSKRKEVRAAQLRIEQ